MAQRNDTAIWSGLFRISAESGQTLQAQIRQAIETNAVDTTLTTLRTRIDALGVREAVIQKQGMAGDRILIQLPGAPAGPQRVQGAEVDPVATEERLGHPLVPERHVRGDQVPVPEPEHGDPPAGAHPSN